MIEKYIIDVKDLLSKTVQKHGNKILYKFDNREITYKEMQEQVNSLGTAMVNKGLKNKKIAIMSENRYEWEISYFAIACGTGVVVPIDKALTKKEVINILKRTQVEAIFCSGKYEETLEESKKEVKSLKYIISFDSNNENSFSNLIKEGKQLIESGNQDFLEATIDNEEVGFIMFTSGTTDKSKAIMLSHKNICSNIENVAKVFPITSKDIVLSVLPLSHIFEGGMCFLLTIYKGAERKYCCDLNNIVEDINKYRISFMGAVPAIYKYIYNKIDELNEENINLFMSGGAILESNLEKLFNEKNIKLVQGYGLTETSPIISISNKKEHKVGSVGKVIPNIEVKIENKDEDGIGELVVKGDNVFLGYYQDEDASKKAFREQWFYTGDLAKIDEDGFVFLHGRIKNLIVLPNGKKIFPEELEAIINKINGVIESFVYDKKLSNNKSIICAKIVCKDLEQKEEILNNIDKLNKNFPIYKHITDIYITNEEINKTHTGKIKRKEELDMIINHQADIKENDFLKSTAKNDDVLNKIRNIISKQLGIEEKSITNEIRISDLGADSLDKVEIIYFLEKEFKIKIGKESYTRINSVKEISEYIKQSRNYI